MKPIDRKLHAECLMHAAHTRLMWLAMKRSGYGWSWDHYRGWLLDAKAFRLGTEFRALGIEGAPKPKVSRALFVAP